ncbi:MAG TPA: nucleotide exchange factor GrpE [Brevibacterium sp.]|nr:nucleotide exchange factor GrpE [Brevibacterium sp.]
MIRDKRRIDPETGDVRPVDNGGAAAGETAGDEQPSGDESEQPGLAEAKAEVADLSDQLSRRNADLYNLQQEYNNYVRRAKAAAVEQQAAGVVEVVEALLGVLDEIELARQHGDLTGPLGAIAEKLESTLTQRFDVERYGAEGEEFDPELHEALMSTPQEGVETTTIAQVMQPGYRVGERVIRAARVAVNSPS